MSILAIDFGGKKIGLALSAGFLAEPLTVLINNKSLFPNFKKICDKFNVEKVIIGLPEGKLRDTVLTFAKTCEKRLGVKVEFEDEILSTNKALELLIEASTTRKKRKRIIDAAAAAVILQQYLDRKKSTS